MIARPPGGPEARGLQPASAFKPAQALNDFARLGWRELKRRERRAPVAVRSRSADDGCGAGDPTPPG